MNTESIRELETVCHIMTAIMESLTPTAQLAIAMTLLDQARESNKMTVEEFVEEVVPEMKKLDELFPFEEEENAEN